MSQLVVKHSSLASYMKDGHYIDENGCEFDDVRDFIQAGILGFCGCGMPSSNLSYVLTSLELICERLPDSIEPGSQECAQWFKEYKARCITHFGNEKAEYFFMYWADKEGLTDHGSGIGAGWLTEDGENLLTLLREWKTGVTPK